MRQAGLDLMQLIMDNEVRQLAGEHYQRRQAEQSYRWGREKGFLVVDGQKVPFSVRGCAATTVTNNLGQL